MANNNSTRNDSSGRLLLDTDFENKLLASKLVSEVRKSPDHFSITLTGTGVLEFAKAMRLTDMEEPSQENYEVDGKSLIPVANGTLISKQDMMAGFRVSHTTLWKWQQEGYLTPVKIGKRVYYKREDVERLAK